MARAVLTTLMLTPVVGCAASVTSSNGVATETSSTTLPPKQRWPLIGDISIEALEVDPLEPRLGDECDFLAGRIWWADHVYLEALAIPVTCDVGSQSSLNSDPGKFRSSADALDFVETLAPVETSIGHAEVFVVDHTLCTNGCRNYPVTVAVVTLTRPVTVDGIDYDVLNLYADDSHELVPDDGERDALNQALGQLER